MAEHVMGTGGNQSARNLYLLLNDKVIRDSVVATAASRYGYDPDQVRLRLYVGRFASPVKGTHEPLIREWAGSLIVGGGPIEVFGLADVVTAVRAAARSTTYQDNAVLVTMKVLESAGLLAAAIESEAEPA